MQLGGRASLQPPDLPRVLATMPARARALTTPGMLPTGTPDRTASSAAVASSPGRSARARSTRIPFWVRRGRVSCTVDRSAVFVRSDYDVCVENAASALATTSPVLTIPCSELGRVTVEERREIVELFFLSHPGQGRVGLGLGRAMADFVEWQASSGRLDEASGSAWWRAVNASFVLDLRTALAADPDGVASAATTAWSAYMTATGDPQRALWTAHQVSLTSAVHAAARLLEREPAEERLFAQIVLAVVARSAAEGVPTDTTDLARSTRRLYPTRYPISALQLEELTCRLSRARVAAARHEGTR